MIRHFKVLTPLLVTVLALSALSASAASSTDSLTSAAEKTILTGHGEDNIFKFTSGSELQIHCWNSTLAGTIDEPSVPKATVLPTYKGKKGEPTNTSCESLIGIVRVDMNGCNYLLTGDTTQEDGGKADAEVKIECPEGKEIEFTNNCKVKIPAQAPTSGGVTYTNGTDNGKGDVTVTFTLTGLTYTAEGSFCSVAGIVPSESDTLDLIGTMTVTGYADQCEVGKCPENGDEFKEGGQVSIEVS
jgi:hypothetical protein